jgi:ABC-2 type transport system ATP-binding protein
MVRRHVGYMAENDVFVPGLNAAQTVRLAAELCGIPSRRSHEAAAEALQAVGLGEEAFHNPSRLSTGQRQKMKLAAALVHAPRLLILDEPTNGLDPAARRTMLELVQELAAEKSVSVILSTHILPDVQAVCQDALVLRDGLVAGHEQIQDRVEMRDAKTNWYRVETLGDPEPFATACAKAGLEVRSDGGLTRVAAPTAASLLKLARASGTVLVSATPATTGAEERILASLEGQRPAPARFTPAAANPTTRARQGTGTIRPGGKA